MVVNKGDLTIDPRGLIFEAYRIEGIGPQDCRTIFFDWALGLPPGTDPRGGIETLLTHYRDAHPDHPMTAVLEEGRSTAQAPRRRGGRSGRNKDQIETS